MQLPRFLLEKSYMLGDFLQTLNVTTVFQDAAEITEMGAEGPRLSQVSALQVPVCPSVCLPS